jgi:hypothetical protein
VVLKPWMYKLMPFLARWQDTAPAACCGHCGPCITATVTGLTLEMKAARSEAPPTD